MSLKKEPLISGKMFKKLNLVLPKIIRISAAEDMFFKNELKYGREFPM